MRLSNIVLIFIYIFGVFNSNAQKGKNIINNSYLIYSWDKKTNDTVFFADFFYANFSDTIIKVNNPFGARFFNEHFNKYGTYYSQTPYSIKKRKDGIYYSYYEYGKTFTLKRYSFILCDTIKYARPSKERSVGQFDYSVYAGIDTIIYFNGYKYKCKKFIDKLFSFKNIVMQETYLENKTLVPLIIKHKEYSYDSMNPLIGQSIYVLRFVLPRNEVLTTEFSYPDSFYDR